MSASSVNFSDWRAQVESDLEGVSFDRACVRTTTEGLQLQPLYVSAPVLPPVGRQAPFVQVCSRATHADEVREATEGGADAVWVDSAHSEAAAKALASGLRVFIDDALSGPAIAADPLSRRATVGARFDLNQAWAELTSGPLVVSSLPYHGAGAEHAEELACALSAGVACLRHGVDSKALGFRLAVGAQTFFELAKLRALRLCWAKVLSACQAEVTQPLVHAVGSPRTLTQRDPWVNMIRGTTQAFVGLVGGADVVTVLPFDEALGGASAEARRLARNTVLVLRDESHLSHFVDPARGSYALDSLTEVVAREAWKRFSEIEAAGGLAAQVLDGRLAARLGSAWALRQQALATRKQGLVGVSEFANVDEELPSTVRAPAPAPAGALPQHTDAEAFEVLRAKADRTDTVVKLVTLGSFAESRARVGFATNLFAAGGFKTEETTTTDAASVVCLCGTDERYASDAVARVTALKAAGAKQILVAGKPGALEAALTAAGVDQFIFMGCDVVKVLTTVLARGGV